MVGGLLRFLFLVFLSVVLLVGAQAADTWKLLDDILNAGVLDHAFPGAVGTVRRSNGEVLYHRAVGHFTYGDPAPENGNNPPVSPDTVYDMASLTKVLVPTTMAAQLYQKGLLPLYLSLCDDSLLGRMFCSRHPEKKDITALHLLAHNAGFEPDPIPGYYAKSFGCPETSQRNPEQVFSCQRKIHTELASQGISHRPGGKYIYSDLSMMTMMFLLGKIAREHDLVTLSELDLFCAMELLDAGGLRALNVTGSAPKTLGQVLSSAELRALKDSQLASSGESRAVDQCFFEAYARRFVLEPVFTDNGQGAELHREFFTYRPAPEVRKTIAPTELDTWYTNKLLQGQVHDSNAYACGGFQGHAGLFGTGLNTTVVLNRWLHAAEDDPLLNRTTAELFRRVVDSSFSPRALGWDTNAVTPSRPHGSSHCGTLSVSTFMHTGYTGTMVCADPERQISVVLLTNRVYPTRENSKVGPVRNKFARAVQEIFDNL